MRNKIQMKALVIKYLDSLAHYFSYHNTLHTCNVLANVVFIGCNEDLEKHDLELLMTAALWHDTGLILTYKDHEEASCQLCQKHLPDFGYSPEEVEIVISLIMDTKLPNNPTNLLSQILLDSDVAYLGTSLAQKRSTDLFHELQHFDSSLTHEKWVQTQIQFLDSHRFYTQFGISFLESPKQAYLQTLRLQAL